MVHEHRTEIYTMRNKNHPENIKLTFVIPLFNECEVFNELVERLDSTLDSLEIETEVLLVDDGSKDGTRNLLQEKVQADSRYSALFLSRNHGHQQALTAGLMNVDSRSYVFVLDGDLQDPPELIHDFLAKMNEGFDVVYGVRKKRKASVLKKLAYWLYYRMISGVSSIELPIDSGDFCLMKSKVVRQLNRMPESDRYIRGMRTWVGFKQTGFAYERPERAAGVSKYSWTLLFRLAYSGLFNFSRKPIHAVAKIGTSIVLVAMIYLFYVLYQKIIHEENPEGFTAIVSLVILSMGINLLALGVVGEYVYRTFELAKKRPLYVVEKLIRNGLEQHVD